MHIVHLNLVFERTVGGRALVERYATLSTLAARQAAAGARVTVLQRFDRDETLDVDGVRFEFRRDVGRRPAGKFWMVAPRLTHLARRLQPDVVHLHGLWFVAQTQVLRWILPARAAVVVQDHATKPWASRILPSARRALLAAADGILLNSAEMAAPLRDAGVLPYSVPCYPVVECSSSFAAVPRDEARRRVSLDGDPLVLWVGRLQPVKDPLTAVEAFCRAAAMYPRAKLVMIFREDDLLGQLRETVVRHELFDRVTFVGRVAHEDLEDYYSAADLFVTAGVWEGSNYALIEAMACGCWPVCSNIPSHQGMTGSVGHLFEPGDAEACRRALESAMSAGAHQRRERSQEVRARFDAALSWDAIVEQTFRAYHTARADMTTRLIG